MTIVMINEGVILLNSHTPHGVLFNTLNLEIQL